MNGTTDVALEVAEDELAAAEYTYAKYAAIPRDSVARMPNAFMTMLDGDVTAKRQALRLLREEADR